MTGNEDIAGPGSNGTGIALKKSIGRIIISINSEILELVEEYKKVKQHGIPLSKKGESRAAEVKKKKVALEEALKSIENRPGFVEQEKMEKLVDMMKKNIITAEKALNEPNDEESSDNIQTEASDAQKTASEAIEEIEVIEEQTESEMRSLAENLSSMATVSEPDVEVSAIEREKIAIGQYQCDRYNNMLKAIEKKMDFHKADLLAKWSSQKELLDYQALKEFRSEFETTHKKLSYMVSEWERRKFSDRLSDHLMDIIGRKYDEYMAEYRRMDELKRTEAAVQRKRHLELEEYKREKRRAIPTWPNSFPYTKWKPDMISWDREHHLTTGSVKFGLLAEMLKSQGRVTIYEQIQVRLGNNRNDVNIITQVVALLDTINEETVYNKLSNAWEAVITLKKTKDQTLNDFFSKFETVQYSLNLADDSYKEQEPLEAGKDKKYYEERELMVSRKIEMNDKLKAVQLIKALGVDGTYKRDILAKVNFNHEPSKVYQDTKTAIRDICGDKADLTSNKTADEDADPVNVNVVKPWQDEGKTGGRRDQERFSRSRSWDRRGGSFRDRSRSYSRDRRSFRDGRSSRERSRERSDS